ncbi:alanine racemase [Stenotrophobium rhamnosiphilum]|uniref:Alanine racemase n=1 Tax=Stenotrophobium rhamnosiphilum TaxID=2029166 RepID=A0A2T5MES6_9GAMM|nr:alanine racemase [Stenotrophobium rhamnosiphilum]PTU31067.1 alanine racemase [Stenotrophobium rhamnosiphilum]
MIPRVIATIDLAAIQHNLAQVRRYAPQSRVMAAIKAQAYGHGAVPVARALESTGVDAFAVACLEEAIQLRQAHIKTPIVLLEGILSAEEAVLAADEQFQIAVHDHWQLSLLEALPESAEVSIWFKLDSGMHRLGFPLNETASLVEILKRRPRWRFMGWMTHLACADELNNPATQQQIEKFNAALKGLPGARSIANSAGILAWPETHGDWVRPGLMIYGASPLPDRSAADLGLRAAMTLESRLIAIREYDAGEGIGYGQTYRCPERMSIGVVAVGYADGVPRILPNGTPVLVNDTLVPMAGRVSMDMITIDLRTVPNAKIGDTVRLWGEGLPAEVIAAHAGTLAYELFCGLTQRVQFVYKHF